jgi:hypothetical protein
MEGGYVGHETNIGCPRLKTKTCYYWGLLRFARNDNRLYHRKNKRTVTFSAMEGGYVGHETNAGCSSPRTQKKD